MISRSSSECRSRVWRRRSLARQWLFSWIVFKSRVHRDRVNAKAMKDSRLAGMCDSKSMPFDTKRVTYGGFKVLVGA